MKRNYVRAYALLFGVGVLLTQSVNAQIIYTYAGTGATGYTGDGGLAISAKMNDPSGVAIDASGNIYISDTWNNVIRKVSTTGVITTFAGTGANGSSGDGGPATAAELYRPSGICFDNSGNMYIADALNGKIRKINTSGTISTVAGNGTLGYTGDGGPATAAELYPGDVKIYSGNLFISDFSNNVIREVNSSGTISTIAGNGTAGFSGDGGPATAAKLSSPQGIAIDASGNIFFADNGNCRVRKINTSGTISTVAGNGTYGFSGNGGPATAAEFENIKGVALDGTGNLYITDYNKSDIRKVNTAGTISTYAGDEVTGYTGDGGLATAAEIGFPYFLTVGTNGNIWFADVASDIVRAISTTCPANAGPLSYDVQSCCGRGYPGVQIGALNVPILTYSWSPSTNLNHTNIAQPISTWTSTTAETYTLTVSNSNCTTNTSTVQVIGAPYTGNSCCRLINPQDTIVVNQALPVHFSVFPNPANSSITIDVCGNADYLRIYDINGRVVYEKTNIIEGVYYVDVSGYSRGIYFVHVTSEDSFNTQKIVVE